MKQTKRALRLVCTLILLAAMTGCAAKYARTSTGTEGQTKFLYTQGSQTGVIKCDTNDQTGALTNCREMIINYQD